MKRWYLIAVAALGALVGGIALAHGSNATADRPTTLHPQTPTAGGVMVSPRGNTTAAEARAFRRFPIYSAGDSFRQLPLNAIFRAYASRPAFGEPLRADYMTFLYGSCESIGGTGCQVPLQVQVWNACERHRSSYQGPNGPAINADETLTIRGVPAAFYEDFTRLELYTGQATIVLFTNVSDRAFLLDAASQLRGFNVETPATARLPAPAAKAAPLGCNAS